MIIENIFITKKEYCSPTIEIIKLDSEIALQLQSEPPAGPGEGYGKAPEHFNCNPMQQFKA